LAWVYQKVDAIMKRVGKGFLKLLFGKRWVHFSAKKCCVKCAKKAMPKEKADKG
jgi:hypothetical protein